MCNFDGHTVHIDIHSIGMFRPMIYMKYTKSCMALYKSTKL